MWLFFSAFAMEMSDAQTTNAWLSGAAAVVFSLLALARPQARLLNTALGAWVFATAFAFAGTGEGMWNGAAVGALLFGLSLVREKERHTGPFGHHRRITV